MAVPWLHVIRAHPMFLHLYEDLFLSGLQSSLPRRVLRLLRNAASRTRTLFKSMLHPSSGWSSSHPLPNKADVLIVSHLLNPAFAGKDSDFYFGRFADELRANHLSVLLVLINYTGAPAGPLAAKWTGAQVPRVVLDDTLDYPGEVLMRQQTRDEAIRLKRLSRTAQSPFKSNLLKRASVEVRGGATLHALRLGEQVRKLVAQLSPQAILTTYEGHSWERIVYSAAHAVQPAIRCIGYQHATMFNLQHAALRPLNKQFNPDAIVTAGLVARDAISTHPAMQSTPVLVIGSYRGQSSRTASPDSGAADRPAVCIVLPEGDDREYRLLFGFSLKCAKHSSGIKFIWRLHPNTRFEDLMKLEPEFRNLPSNITISSAPLEQDIACAGWALYRGSTAVIQAAAGGAFPVYLEHPGEIPIDTLFELEGRRGRTSSIESFCATVERKDEQRRAAQMAEIRQYCASVFTPPAPRQLATIVRAPLPFCLS